MSYTSYMSYRVVQSISGGLRWTTPLKAILFGEIAGLFSRKDARVREARWVDAGRFAG